MGFMLAKSFCFNPYFTGSQSLRLEELGIGADARTRFNPYFTGSQSLSLQIHNDTGIVKPVSILILLEVNL